MNGASTNPDAHVVASAGAQVKKGLDIANKLGAENFGKNIAYLWSTKYAPAAMNTTVVNVGCEDSVYYRQSFCVNCAFPPMTLFPWCVYTNMAQLPQYWRKYDDVEYGATNAGQPRGTIPEVFWRFTCSSETFCSLMDPISWGVLQ